MTLYSAPLNGAPLYSAPYGTKTISEEEFLDLLEQEEAAEIFGQIGVDIETFAQVAEAPWSVAELV